MTYGVVVDMSAPLEMYDSLHRELLRTTAGSVEGLLVHLARPTADGFQIIEVWDSREQYDSYNQEVVWPLAAQVWGTKPEPTAAPPTEEDFVVRGLLIPGAGIRH